MPHNSIPMSKPLRDLSVGVGLALIAWVLPSASEFWLAARVIIFLVGIAFIVYGIRAGVTPSGGAEDRRRAWKDLAEQFKEVPPRFWVEWYSESHGFDGKLHGEQDVSRGSNWAGAATEATRRSLCNGRKPALEIQCWPVSQSPVPKQ